MPLTVDYGDDIQGIDVILAPVAARQVTGHVIAQGPIPPGLQVALTPEGDPIGATTSQVRRTIVSANGAFDFEHVPSGDYTLALAEPAVESVPPGQIIAGPRSLSLPKGPTSRGILPVWGRTTVSVRHIDVRDVLLDIRPAAVAVGTVVVVGSSDPQFRRPSSVSLLPAGMTSRFVRTGEIRGDGSFLIEGLIPGDYLLSIAGAIHRVTSHFVPLQGPIRVTEETEILPLEIVIGPGARLAGVVGPLPSLSQEPLSVIYYPDDASLWHDPASPPSRAGRLGVRSDGTYESRATLPPGRYRVIAVPDWIAEHWLRPAFRTAALGKASVVEISAGGEGRLNLEPSRLAVR